MSEIPKLTEVDFDCGIPVFKLDLLKSGALHQAVQLLWKRLGRSCMEIGKENFRLTHNNSPLSCEIIISSNDRPVCPACIPDGTLSRKLSVEPGS